MGFATNCFDSVVGLSRRDCDCFATGRPDAETEVAGVTSQWKFQQFTAPDEPPNPYTLTSTFDLPDDLSPLSLQLFVNGTLINSSTDFTKTAARVLTITTPVSGALYQLIYRAQISAVELIPAYNYSKSGLYIADLIPEELMQGLYTCDETIWDLYAAAKSQAIREFIAAMNSTMMRRNRLKQNTWAGYLGEVKGTDRLEPGSTYAGVRIRTSGLKSGYLRITKIISMFELSDTLSLTIYDGDGYVVTPAFAVTTLAGKKSITEVNITLPLLGDGSVEQDYYIVYTYDADNQGLLNKVFCMPCSRNIVKQAPTYNVASYLNYPRDIHGLTSWHNYVAIGGWQGDSVADFSDAPDELSIYMNGLALEVEMGCDMASGLCGMLSNFDSNPFSNSVAVALQRKWAAILVGNVLRSVAPNRNLQVNREQLAKDAAVWEANFAEIMHYLSTNLPDGANDCVECKPTISMKAILT